LTPSTAPAASSATVTFPLGDAVRGYRNSSWRSQSASNWARVTAGSALAAVEHQAAKLSANTLGRTTVKILRPPFMSALPEIEETRAIHGAHCTLRPEPKKPGSLEKAGLLSA